MTMSTEEIQRALVARGYDIGHSGPNKDGVDGDAGPLTIEALKAFQRSIGLPGYGIPGEKTEAALREPVTGKPAPKPLTDPLWMILAAAEEGTREGRGAINNAEVVKYFADAGFPGIKSDAVAWCAAFVGAMLKRSGHSTSGSLAARSYERWGVGLKGPIYGCVATKKRGNSSWQGHVFFVVGANKSEVFGLGGNQADAVNVATVKRSEITSYRWPASEPIVASRPLPTTVAGAKGVVSEA